MRPVTARLCLDINVFMADLLSKKTRILPTAVSPIVQWVDEARFPGGAVQLVVSIPMLEQWENVLLRHFNMAPEDAAAMADSLYNLSEHGPEGEPPHLILGSDFLPFASEKDMYAAMDKHTTVQPSASVKKLFDENEDDRYVFLTAIAGRADLLITTNMDDFRRGVIQDFGREDMFVISHAHHDLVVAKPFFAAYWLRQGFLPNAGYLYDNPDVFGEAVSIDLRRKS